MQVRLENVQYYSTHEFSSDSVPRVLQRNGFSLDRLRACKLVPMAVDPKVVVTLFCVSD